MRSAVTWTGELGRRIDERRAGVGIVGLGYVGLPLAAAAVRAGFPVVGVDTDRARVAALRSGGSFLTDVDPAELRQLRSALRMTTSYTVLAGCDVVLICVPTPLLDHEPDLSYVKAAASGVGRRLRPGMLVVLESTTYPGTTEEVVEPILERSSGLSAGRDFALAHAPERIDPGRGLEHVEETPRVVGGLTENCTNLAVSFYASLVRKVHAVRTPRDAEMAKLIENTFRHVNIALVNELAIVSRDLGVDIWEALEAAATKPFGFMPFWPGPGVGGHCIAIDPSYLSWRVSQRVGHRMSFIEHAQGVNARMPAYVVQRIGEALNERGKPLKGSRVLGVGVAYKPDVSDCRESPSLEILRRLSDAGARISYHDPFVPETTIGKRKLRSKPLSPRVLAAQDCVVLLTPHSRVDLLGLIERAPLLFDVRGLTRGSDPPNVVRL